MAEAYNDRKDYINGDRNLVTKGLKTNASQTNVISDAVTLTEDDSGGIFSIIDSNPVAAYQVTIPPPRQGLRFVFTSIDPVLAEAVTIRTAAGGHCTGFLTNDAAAIAPLNADNGIVMDGTATSTVGDTVIFEGISTSLYNIRGYSSGAGGLSIA